MRIRVVGQGGTKVVPHAAKGHEGRWAPFFSHKSAAVSILLSLRFLSFPTYIPDELRSVRVKILPASSNETTPDFLLGKVLQTEEDEEATQHCVGDSGSPLVSPSPSLLRGGRSVLLGIAVTGDRNCGGGEPIGFARVTGEIVNWIRYVLNVFQRNFLFYFLFAGKRLESSADETQDRTRRETAGLSEMKGCK